jgi:hypothetical protein
VIEATVFVEIHGASLEVALCGVELLERACVDGVQLILDLRPIVKIYSVSFN